MSASSPQSGDEYEEDTSDGQVNTATDKIVNGTQQVDCAQTETMKDEQSDKHNSTDGQDEDQDCNLPSHVVIETVQYGDYIKRQNGLETNDNEGMIEFEQYDDSDSVQWIEHDETAQPTQSSRTTDTPDIDNSSDTLDHNIRDSQLNVNNEEGSKDGSDEINCREMIDIDDGSDSVQWIEHDHELCAAKKSKIDLTQPNNVQAEVVDQSPRQSPTGEAQPNQINKRIITVHLQCPQSNCLDTFPESQLNRHMLAKHFIGPNRCLVKECEQAYDNKHILREHIKQAHQHTTQLHCNKCVKHFAEYTLLYRHNVDYHQIGHFQCCFPSCAFTGEYKKKLTNHYESQHKLELVCAQSGCLYRTRNPTYFKAHKRSHLGIEPYHCKWPNCHYSNAFQNNAMKHIMRTHFKSRSKTRPDLSHLGKPKDYLEVVP